MSSCDAGFFLFLIGGNGPGLGEWYFLSVKVDVIPTPPAHISAVCFLGGYCIVEIFLRFEFLLSKKVGLVMDCLLVLVAFLFCFTVCVALIEVCLKELGVEFQGVNVVAQELT